MIQQNLFFPKQNQYKAADVDLAEGKLRHVEETINKVNFNFVLPCIIV